jgi:hypothetical protein
VRLGCDRMRAHFRALRSVLFCPVPFWSVLVSRSCLPVKDSEHADSAALADLGPYDVCILECVCVHQSALLASSSIECLTWSTHGVSTKRLLRITVLHSAAIVMVAAAIN